MPTADEDFSIAVIPDTQTEVHSDTDRLFGDRTAWLAANKTKLDLRYVVQTGDLTDWGWVDQPEYDRAKKALAKLTSANLPYSISVGNHDTAAVGWDGVAGSTKYGGAAYMYNPECPSKLGAAKCKSWLLVRDTKALNKNFPSSYLSNLGGTFEQGKIDNVWTTFTANDTKWLVLNLELWPRKTVVEWARTVVASHPSHNVVIQTHHYLSAGGTVSGYNGGYGETSPKYLYDRVVSKYANVKLVFSGHTGGFASHTDKPNGNTVLSFLGNSLGRKVNPVRVVTINTKTGVVTSTVRIPSTGKTVGSTTGTISVIR